MSAETAADTAAGGRLKVSLALICRRIFISRPVFINFPLFNPFKALLQAAHFQEQLIV